MDGKYCEKDKSALIRCPECDHSGKKNGVPCVKCKGTGYLCQIHGGDWKNRK